MFYINICNLMTEIRVSSRKNIEFSSTVTSRLQLMLNLFSSNLVKIGFITSRITSLFRNSRWGLPPNLYVINLFNSTKRSKSGYRNRLCFNIFCKSVKRFKTYTLSISKMAVAPVLNFTKMSY